MNPSKEAGLPNKGTLETLDQRIKCLKTEKNHGNITDISMIKESHNIQLKHKITIVAMKIWRYPLRNYFFQS